MEWLTTRTLSVLLVAVLLCGLAPVAFADYGEGLWLEGWNTRQTVTVEQTAGADMNYSLLFTVDWTSRFRTDFMDLRFTYVNLTELSWWIEDLAVGDYCLAWVRIPVNLTEQDFTFFRFYDNEFAEARFNGSAADVFHRVISEDVVLALPMNEGAGVTATDYSGNGNDGTITSASWVTTGKFGNALSFDGLDDKVVATPPVTAIGSFTLCWWFKWTEGAQAFEDVIGFAEDARAYIWTDAPGGWLPLTGDKDDYIFDAKILENTFYHATMWYDNTNFKGFRDGVAQGAEAAAITIANNNFYIGTRAAAQWFEGIVEAVFIFDSALDPAVIADLAVYYPQCSSANLGSLFLRTWVDGGVNYVTSTDRIENNMEYIYTFGLIAMWIISIALFKFGFPLLNVVFGIVSLGLVAGTLGNEAVIFSPYLQLGLALTAVILMLSSVQRGIKQ